jgi:peroxiredoxin Q/BCP
MSKKSAKKATKKSPAKKSGQGSAKKASTRKTAAKRKSPTKSLKTGKAKTAARAPSKTAPKKAPTVAVRKTAGLTPGSAAPSFFLPRDGGQFVSLASFAGRKLVIFFYPRADTPGCTKEAMDFSRLASDFAACETAVLGVSADPLKAQESFRDKHQLGIPLVSDEKHLMLGKYGVWGEKSMYGKSFMGVLRTTVLIDAAGKIVRVWPNVKVEGHADEVLKAAQMA